MPVRNCSFMFTDMERDSLKISHIILQIFVLDCGKGICGHKNMYVNALLCVPHYGCICVARCFKCPPSRLPYSDGLYPGNPVNPLSLELLLRRYGITATGMETDTGRNLFLNYYGIYVPQNTFEGAM